MANLELLKTAVKKLTGHVEPEPPYSDDLPELKQAHDEWEENNRKVNSIVKLIDDYVTQRLSE